MTAAEKILAGITQSAEDTAAERLNEAEQKAAEIRAAAETEAEKAAAEVLAQAQNQVAVITETGRSGAALLIRDARLDCRRAEIDRTFAEAREKLLGLPDAEYFDFLATVLAQTDCRGTLYLNERDLKRDTVAFAEKLSARGIVLSGESVPLDGGFLLKDGEIEINASLTALFREKRSDLVDAVNRILFQ